MQSTGARFATGGADSQVKVWSMAALRDAQATIAELIQAARPDQVDRVVSQDDARRQLAPLGIRVVREREVKSPDGELIPEAGVAIASSAARFGREILRGTQWEGDWSRPLRELAGAQPLATTHFAAGLKSRGTLLPFSHFDQPEPVALDGEIPL